MHSRILARVGVLIIGSLSLFFRLSAGTKWDNKIRIMASVFPLMDFAKAVAGEKGDVRLLLPPGADIHSWQPRMSDMVALASSDLFIYIGSSLEPWVEDVLESVARPQMKLFETSRNLPLLEEKAGDSQERKSPEFDPHIWLDFTLDEKIVRRISDICAEIAPESAAHFKGNAASYISKLQALDQKYANNLKNCRQRVFVTGGHAAFSYLAKRYNLEQVALYGMSPDAQPTPKHLIKVMTLARQMNLRAVFFEKNVSRKLANQIAQETGAAALVLNPGASLTKEQLRAGASFIDLMEENLKNLSYGLNCR